MRLEGLRVEREEGLVRRTIGFAWIGGEMEVSVEVPAEYAPDDADCSPFSFPPPCWWPCGGPSRCRSTA